MKKLKKLVIAAVIAVLSGLSYAGPIDSFSTTLSGDPRPDSPDGILLNVDANQNGADEGAFIISVDFDPSTFALHPQANLHEFYFNLAPEDTSFWDLTILSTGWDLVDPATVVGGGAGGNQFMFEYTDPARPDAVLPLEFLIETADNSEITSENFFGAAEWTGADGALMGQLGAHVRMLGEFGEDSGFAVGQWCADASCGGNVDPRSIDAPSQLALLALGLIGLGVARRLSGRA